MSSTNPQTPSPTPSPDLNAGDQAPTSQSAPETELPKPGAEADKEFTLGAGFDFTDPNSPLARYYGQTSHVIAAALLAVCFLVVSSMALWHTDIWGHLKFGEWMVQHGRLPDHEPFCDLGDKETPYVTFATFSQIGLYLVYRLGASLAGGSELEQMAGGVELLRTLHAILMVLRFGLLLGALRRVSGSWPLALAGMALAMILAATDVGVLRPQAVAETLFAAVLFMLSRPVLSRSALVAIPLVMVLWANTHGSYPVGLVFMGACLAGGWARELVQWLAKRKETEPAASRTQGLGSSRRLLWVLVGSVIGIALLNPHGPWLFWYTLQLSRHPNIPDMDEWKPISFDDPLGLLFLASVLLILLTQGLRLILAPEAESSPEGPSGSPPEGGIVNSYSASTGPWFSVTQLLIILGFGVQTYLHQRMMPWWAMLVPWLILPHWAVILRRSSWLTQDRSVPSLKKTLIAVLLVWAVAMWSGPVSWLMNGEPRDLERAVHPGTPWRLAAQLQNPEESLLPPLANWLKRHTAGGGFPGRIFATETQGDYLIWALPADMPISMYTHVHLFPAEAWADCKRVKFGTAEWREVLDRQRANVLVFESELHPALRRRILADRDTWEVILDETGDPQKRDVKGRVMIVVRKKPV